MPGGHLIEISEEAMRRFEIRWYDGYKAPFTRQQYEPAKFKNGARVRKMWEDKLGDLHGVGELGTVLGSIGHPDIGAAYFVEWDGLPRMPTFAIESKLGPA